MHRNCSRTAVAKGKKEKVCQFTFYTASSIVKCSARFNAMQDPSDGRSDRAAATSSVLWPCSDASRPLLLQSTDGHAQCGTSGADSGTNAVRT